VVILLLAVAWLVYRPGLPGDFLFDDFANLPALGATGPVDHWAAFWRYITSGTADPTGRPLSLLTFLIDARDWPAAPYPFKVTNVLLHLLNGALLSAVLLRLGRALHLTAPHAAIGALFGAGAWLLHPLFVSTTLYVVQREAMLPATFVLIGMLGWIAAREMLARGEVVRGLTGMLLASWGCTVLAVLSKANGALLPLLLLLVEWIVLAPHQPAQSPSIERKRQTAVLVLLVLPTLLLCVWMLEAIPSMTQDATQVRAWTIGQRLLTEPRVLTDYLRLLFIPQAHSSGLFNDAFLASTGWLHPASTLPCIALILALIGAGFALRKQHPAIALALLFYFAGQLLESTWIPLELYYEHRNYLPAMLLFWPIGICVGAHGAWRWLRCTCLCGVLVLLAMLTYERAALWGSGYKQAQIWAAVNQDSARAQANAALYDMAHGRPRLAAARLQLSLARHPEDIQAPINLVSAECSLGNVRSQTLAAARDALEQTPVGAKAIFDWFDKTLAETTRHACSGLDFAALQSMLGAMHANLNWRGQPGRQQDLDHMQGLLDLAESRPQAALLAFNRALTWEPKPGAALKQAAILGSLGYPALGLAHLDYYATLPATAKPSFGMSRIHAFVLARQRYWEHETERLRATLKADAAAETKSM
jgi:tetratricopeptide (TPR) repeat protein